MSQHLYLPYRHLVAVEHHLVPIQNPVMSIKIYHMLQQVWPLKPYLVKLGMGMVLPFLGKRKRRKVELEQRPCLVSNECGDFVGSVQTFLFCTYIPITLFLLLRPNWTNH